MNAIKHILKTIQIPAANTDVPVEVTLLAGYNYLGAVSFEFGSSADADMVYQDELTQAMNLDGTELFPAGYDVKRFVSGVNVNPCKRKCLMNREINCNGAKITFTVRNTATVPTAHQLKFYVWLSTEPMAEDSCMC
jgi:hypothetical protein